MKELRETARMMESADYRERFRAEYHQTRIRQKRLHRMLVKYDAGTLEFTPVCDAEILREQEMHMGDYLRCLEVRAEIENIPLDE